jgi:hypothetical protein
VLGRFVIEIRCSYDGTTDELFFISDREDERGTGGESPEHRFQEADDRVVAPSLKALKSRKADLPGSHLREPVGKRAVSGLY